MNRTVDAILSGNLPPTNATAAETPPRKRRRLAKVGLRRPAKRRKRKKRKSRPRKKGPDYVNDDTDSDVVLHVGERGTFSIGSLSMILLSNIH